MTSNDKAPAVVPAARELEFKIGISRRVTIADVLPPPGYPGSVPYRWSERTVLKRWRRKTTRADDGSVYRGTRLFPSLWRLLARLRDLDVQIADVDDVRLRDLQHGLIAEARARGEHLAYVAPDMLRVLVAHLARAGRLDAILCAHEDGRHGVPDLFLVRERGGQVLECSFVEVKRHGEAVSDVQIAELSLLRGLGLRAGIFRFKPEPQVTPGE